MCIRDRYNSAVLRSRRLQKQITELSLTSLPVENFVPHHGRPDNARHAPEATAELQPLGAKSHHRFASQAKESIHVATVPFDSRHFHSKPVPNQNRSNTSALASSIHVGGNGIRTGDRGQCYGTHRMNMTDRAESCTMVDKKKASTNTGGVLSPAVGSPSSPDVPKMLPAYGNTRAVEMYATLPRKSRQRKTTQQHWTEVGNVPQQTVHSGISHMCWNPRASGNVSRITDDPTRPEMSKPTRQDRTPIPGHSSLPRLKISWLVTNNV